MADWASRANYDNPLFIIYHTLQFAKHKGMYGGKKKRSLPITTVTPGQCVRRHRSATPPSRTGARNVKDWSFAFYWVGVLWPQLSKLLKPVRLASEDIKQKQNERRTAAYLSPSALFMCSSQGRA